MTFKVISGGQTGADFAGLEAAKHNGFPTGGTAPEDYWTTAGSNREVLSSYGLVELIGFSGAEGYRRRTAMNAGDGDFTIAIASNFMSPGEILTRNTCKKLGKKLIPLHFHTGDDLEEWLVTMEPEIDKIVKEIMHLFLVQEDVTLNVAGNSERSSPRCYEFAFAACDKIFKRVRNEAADRSI